MFVLIETAPDSCFCRDTAGDTLRRALPGLPVGLHALSGAAGLADAKRRGAILPFQVVGLSLSLLLLLLLLSLLLSLSLLLLLSPLFWQKLPILSFAHPLLALRHSGRRCARSGTRASCTPATARLAGSKRHTPSSRMLAQAHLASSTIPAKPPRRGLLSHHHRILSAHPRIVFVAGTSAAIEGHSWPVARQVPGVSRWLRLRAGW